jgi:hypothetical protein
MKQIYLFKAKAQSKGGGAKCEAKGKTYRWRNKLGFKGLITYWDPPSM